MKKSYLMLAGLAVLMVAFVGLNAYADKDSDGQKVELPDAVKAAVEALYPGAEIEEAELEEEDGVAIYEVEVELGEVEVCVELTADGTVVEVEEEIDADALPQAIKDALAGGEIEEATMETAYYVVSAGALTKLDTPEITYEVEVEQDDKEMDIEFAPDGTVVEIEEEIDADALPQAIKDALAGGEIEEATMETVYYIFSAGALTELDTPEITYKVEVEQGETEMEIEFAPDGTILKQEEADDDDDDDDHDDDDDDDDDD